jgi:thymidylate kinase
MTARTFHSMRTPPLICLTGIDGCGKSTQARLLAQRMREAGWDVAVVWTGGRPYLSRPLVNLVKRRFRAPLLQQDGRFVARDGSTEAVAADFDRYLERSHALFQRWGILRRGWTDVSLVEHALEAHLAVSPARRSGQAVICDRYLLKSVVNLAVLMDVPLIALPNLLRHPVLRLVPQPTVYILLDIPADVGFARKDDLPSRTYLDRRVPIYRALAAYTGMPVVDGTQAPEDVAAEVWDAVARHLSGEVDPVSGLRLQCQVPAQPV